MGDSSRVLRRDAEANLERILAAATAVFAEQGMDISIEVIARRAGVGLGTVYRRFANKQALLDELARRLLADVVAVAERHLADPAGTGLAGYFWELGELLATHRGFMAHMWDSPGTEAVIARSRDLQGHLLADAQAHELARPELTAEDIAVACWSLQGVLDTTRGLPVDAWQRHLEILLAGLAPGPALTRPALTPRDMDAVIEANPLGPRSPGTSSACRR